MAIDRNIHYAEIKLGALIWRPVAHFIEEVNPRLAKRPLIFNGRLANRGLTSLVKEAIASGPFYYYG